MRNMTVLLPLLVLFLTNPLFSAENNPTRKISIAVVKIKTINCDENLGYVTEDSLSAKLVATNKFTMMDKTQMDRIAQKAGFADFDITNNLIVARLGRTLKVDKIIVGTITGHNGFAFDIRTVDSMNSSIDTVITDDIDNESEIETAINRITEKIQRYYMGYGKIDGFFELTANFGALVPSGTYASHLGAAYGGSLSANINKVGTDRTGITFLGGAYKYIPKDKRYKTCDQFPIAAGFFYKFNPQQNIVLRPTIGSGVVLSNLNYDVDGVKANGMYQYEKRTYQNFCVFFRFESALYVYDRWMLTLSPGYVYIFDKTKPGALFMIDAGIKTLF